MRILKLSISQLKSKPINSILSVCMFALGMGIISLLLHFEKFTEQQITGNLAGIDLVAGAKGSPLQLIISSVLHADNPTGNISLKEANKISRNPLVKKTVPIALGDNFKGFRIVGTTPEYLELYHAKLNEGSWNKKTMEVVIGNVVAKKTGLKTGDEFTGVHGFMEEGHHHDDHKYTVTGELKTTGTVLDRLIITKVESVWHVHETSDGHHDHEHHEHDHHHEHGHDCDHSDEKTIKNREHKKSDQVETILHKMKHQEELTAHEVSLYYEYKENIDEEDEETGKEITALLVFYRNPIAATTLPRMINQNTKMQAASPAIELNRLMSLLGYGFNFLQILAWIIIIFSGINIMIHLLNKLSQEIYEIALLRSLGVTRTKILFLLFWQSIILAISGWIIGLIIVRIAIFVINNFAGNAAVTLQYVIINKELVMLLYALGVGLLSAILPAIRAYRTDVHFLLNKL